MRYPTALLDGLYRLCGWIAAGALVTIGILILISIVSRPLGIYVPGLNAYAGYAMAASTFFGLSYAFRRGSHIRVNLMLSRLKGGRRKQGEIWCLAIAGGLGIFLAYYLIKLMVVTIDFGDVSEAADATPLWIPQLSLAIGGTVFAIALIDRLLRVLLGIEPADLGGGEVQAE